MIVLPAMLMMLSLAATIWLRQQRQCAAPFANVWNRVVGAFRPKDPASEHTAAAEAAQRAAKLIRDCADLHRTVRVAVVDLPIRPLRDVLESELVAIERVLMSPELTRHSAARRWDRVEAMIARAREDLGRVHRIATSASTMPPGMRNTDAMPRTGVEAREVLGVSAVAEERIVKKVVDALRQSWHPDHAANAEDRRARELRLKQINVAWDLINSRRAEAA
jgi:hypothetical protein